MHSVQTRAPCPANRPPAANVHEGRTEPKRSWRRLFAGAIAAIPLASVAVLGLNASAQAASPSQAPAGITYLYNINPSQACQEQGHFGASLWNTTPSGWFCYDLVPSPPFWAPAGEVDMQGWCNRHVPGSRAIIYQNNAWGWKCARGY